MCMLPPGCRYVTGRHAALVDMGADGITLAATLSGWPTMPPAMPSREPPPLVPPPPPQPPVTAVPRGDGVDRFRCAFTALWGALLALTALALAVAVAGLWHAATSVAVPLLAHALISMGDSHEKSAAAAAASVAVAAGPTEAPVLAAALSSAAPAPSCNQSGLSAVRSFASTLWSRVGARALMASALFLGA